MQQLNMISKAGSSIRDAYLHSYNLQQNTMITEAQATLDGVQTIYNFLNNKEIIKIGKTGYDAYQAANAFSKGIAYALAPIPTVADEFFAVGFVIKGIYHLIKGLREIIK